MKKKNRQRQPLNNSQSIQAAAADTVPSQFFIHEGAQLELAAAEPGADGRPRVRAFTMTAYTGGAMQLNGLHWPVVVDLSGVQVSSQRRPILFNHEIERIVGHTEQIEVSAQRIKVAGKMSGVGDDVARVLGAADNGFPWQASIGAMAQQMEFVERGNTVKVNGRNFDGPIYVARKTSLREISFVALGADDNTSASIAAGPPQHSPNPPAIPPHSQEKPEMGFQAWLKAKGFEESTLSEGQIATLKAAYEAEINASNPTRQPGQPPAGDDTQTNPTLQAGGSIDTAAIQSQIRQIQADEARRLAAIRAAISRHNVSTIRVGDQDVDLAAHAIAEGWDADRVELHCLRASRASSPAIHTRTFSVDSNVLQAAFDRSCHVPNAEAGYNQQTLEAADRNFRHGLGLQQLLIMAAAQAGFPVSPGPLRNVNRQFLAAAFTMAEISGILSNTANKLLLASFTAVDQTWREIAARGEVNNFHTHTRYRLVDNVQFKKVGSDGKLKHGELSDENFTNKAETHGRLLSLTRQDIINDDLGALRQLTRLIGRGAALQLNEVFWKEFLDNASFFTGGRANYFEGASTNLQHSSLETAEKMFMDQTDPGGKPLGLMPAILLTGTGNSVIARELFTSTNIVTGSTGKNPSANIFAGKYRPLSSPYVSNTAMGGTATAWYLLANPEEMATIEVVFLNGQETPVIEEAEADFDTLGVQMRGYFDFGAAKQEYRAGVKSKGAA